MSSVTARRRGGLRPPTRRLGGGRTSGGPVPKRWLGPLAGGLLVGALAAYLGLSGSTARVLALAVVLVPVVLWKRPYLAPAVLVAAAVLFEQGVAVPHIPLTDRVPMFEGVGVGHFQGADLLLLVVLAVYVVKGREWGPRWFPRTHVSLALRCVLACTVMALVVGQLHHGDLRVALMEARPYVYLVATYFVTAVFVRDRRAIRAVLWAFVATVAFKALQGTYVWYHNRHFYPKPESYISHEASYFFVIYMILVLALWFFDQRGTLRTWATRLLPLIIWADIVNDRRAAWEMLGGALLCFGVIAYRAMPIRRRLLGKAVVGLVLVSAVYFPLMWDSNGSLAQPARAIKSQVSPSARDADSDAYREQENDNLELNIFQDGLLGNGFGVKIDYALPITDISQTDPLIAYIPHDDVLDVLMRMGPLGGLAMWFLIAAGIISGSRLAMSRDRELAVVGMVLACAIVAYALMGAVDQGFFFFRIAFITGTLLGLAEAARRLARTEQAARAPDGGAPPPARTVPPAVQTTPPAPSAPSRGSGQRAARRPSPARVPSPVGRGSDHGASPARRRPAGRRADPTPRRTPAGTAAAPRRTPTRAPVDDRAPADGATPSLHAWEEQTILDRIDTWGRPHRRHRPPAGRGLGAGTVFVSPSALLSVVRKHRVTHTAGPVELATVPDADRVLYAIGDTVTGYEIGRLPAPEHDRAPDQLLFARALEDRQLGLVTRLWSRPGSEWPRLAGLSEPATVDLLDLLELIALGHPDRARAARRTGPRPTPDRAR